jgi:hypothetical protein
MNALSLLTKGHTIRGLKEGHGAYKLLDKNALPHFDPPKRPISASPHLEPQNTQPAGFEQMPAKAEKPVFGNATEVPAPASAPSKWHRSMTSFWRLLYARVGVWLRTKNPWRKPLNARSAGIQTELDLDKVKVMRNDLSEYDLEVVPMENKPEPKPERENQAAHP